MAITKNVKHRVLLGIIIAFFLIPAGMYPQSGGFTDADYTRHLRGLKKRIPGDSFSVVLQKPFFVIGNMPRKVLEDRWAKGTIAWAVEKLKERYFKKDPNKILDIWLFKDNHSYRRYAKLLWNSEPSTHFGYYSRHHGVLVMNIATGGGTLVHEIVHPFMESNFEDCPDWFNEGMGSLYEQSFSLDGKIIGLTNWRLAGLQQSIRYKRLPSFKTLLSSKEFYSLDYGYAQARYLCYYLQNRGLLEKFYQSFTANVKKDPTGYKTLKKVLGVRDMNLFQKKWEAWVMKLKFPQSI
ncbi:MAG: hypothetical protein GY754_39265 [bacterium]|nr:hypothetical protein [bacterium]